MNQPLVRIRESVPGRLPMLTIFAGFSSSLALPWIPDAITERIRGAIVHDVASRAGLAVLPDARRILTAPSFEMGHSNLARLVRFSAVRTLVKWVPLGSLLPAALAAFSAFALGHLFERYLEMGRTESATRIGVDEATQLRRAIDRAILMTLTIKSDGEKNTSMRAGEELRDALTQLGDTLLLGAATVPAWLESRLEIAFDEALRR